MTLDLSGHRNAGEAFAAQVARGPDRPALTVYRGARPDQQDVLSFAELSRRARWRAAGFAARFAPGDRVLISLPTCVEYAELYLACLLAGLVAVPAPEPSSSAGASERVALIAADCAPALVVTTAGDHEELSRRMAEHGLGRVQVEEPGEVDQTDPGAAPAPPGPVRVLDRDTLAVLQYSSGSTGLPKGVMLAHGDILSDVTAFGEGCEITGSDVFGSWIPLHHDMGLFAHLSAALFLGAPIVLMPPRLFVRRPADWLRMMSDFRVTVTAAPNFAYDLCRRAIPEDQSDQFDLSALRVVINGSEPIHVPTMAGFTERFSRARLRPTAMTPAYGLAEATVYVASKRPGTLPVVVHADPARMENPGRPELVPVAEGAGKPLVSVGRVMGVQARIVDPRTRLVLPEGAVGELWLRGASIGRGYWHKPEPTQEIFRARLEGRPAGEADQDWLRTGDLAAALDGELYITGRIKEMLIVRGRNIFPQDLEQEARAAAPDALGGLVGAAFGVAAPDERIVLVHEVSPKVPAAQLPEVAAAVARRLSAAAGAPVRNVLLLRRGSVRRTTSGKIQRGGTRARFLAGELDPLYADVEPCVLALVGAPAEPVLAEAAA